MFKELPQNTAANRGSRLMRTGGASLIIPSRSRFMPEGWCAN
jgi:hypothetical protein